MSAAETGAEDASGGHRTSIPATMNDKAGRPKARDALVVVISGCLGRVWAKELSPGGHFPWHAVHAPAFARLGETSDGL